MVNANRFATRPQRSESAFGAFVRRHIVLTITLAILVAISLMAGSLLLANYWDESLNPEIRAALDAKHDTLPSQENLFFAMLALDSKTNGDLNRQGQELYARYLHALQTRPDSQVTFDSASPFERKPFAGNKASLCGGTNQREDCFESALANPNELRKLIADNQWLLDRYKDLLRYKHLQNPLRMTVETPFPSWAPFVLGKRLLLTEIALQIASGEVEAGLEQLRKDFAFTRKLLAESDIYLFDKIILMA